MGQGWIYGLTPLPISVPIKVIQEILSELRLFVAIKMGSTDFFFTMFTASTFLFRHPSNTPLQ
jgi:hypothetical protein